MNALKSALRRFAPIPNTNTDAVFYLYGDGDKPVSEPTTDMPALGFPETAKATLTNRSIPDVSYRVRYWALLDTIGQMAALSENHTYAVDEGTAAVALELLTEMSERQVEPPRIFSTDADGLTLSWDYGKARRYLNIDGNELDVLDVRRPGEKVFCPYPIDPQDALARSEWLDSFAGKPVVSTASEDAI
jgi:hypothetical protein